MRDDLWRLRGIRCDGARRPRLRIDELSIAPGVTAVLGPSGAGKTTLLNLLVGFDRPDAGEIETALAHHAGDVFWVPPDDGLWPQLSVRDHLAAVAPPGEAGEVDALLQAFGLTEVSGSKPGRLSAGQADRLSVARALASGARVMVMDEPLVHVEASLAGRCWSAIRRRLAADGAALVFATHELRGVVALAEHAVCLDESEVIYAGNLRELYDRPATPKLAAMLGPANWFDPGDAALWLGDGHEPGCYRPHRIAIEADPAGPCTVVDSSFAGELTETQVAHGSTGATRRVLHRTHAPLAAGQRVALRVVCALLMMATLVGCGGGDAEAVWPVREVKVHGVPAEGPTRPAPRGVANGAEGEMLVLDNAGRVLVYGYDGQIKRKWFMPDYSVGKPEGVCRLDDGRVCVADTHYHRVVVFNEAGEVVQTFGEKGEGPGRFIYPVAIASDGKGYLYVSEYGGNDRVQKFTEAGEFVLAFGSFGTGDGQFQRPMGVAWRDGRVYVADAINNRVQVFSDAGVFERILRGAGEPIDLRMPYDLSVDDDGLLYTPEYQAGRLTVLDAAGKLVGRFGSTGGGPRQLSTPWGLAVDRRGHVWIADTGNRRLLEVAP